MFSHRHVNRIGMPDKFVLVCEDDMGLQARFLERFSLLFGTQHRVQVSVCSSSWMAAAILEASRPDLLILDHDMPTGNGSDLLRWMAATPSCRGVPVMTASGIEENNDHMMSLGATCRSSKERILDGREDDVIRSILGL